MNTTLRNWIILGALSITAMAMACQCLGGAPTLVLDIPAVTATRMTPCVVSASVDFGSSSTGDSSSWDQCRIMWQLEADGTALDDWPDKYRYAADPRPGLNSKQIDLSGQTDTTNFNRPRGFAWAWCLTQGTWRIKCTVTNPEGSSTTTTSSDITIASNSRTQYTVQASGGDYTTLEECLADDPLTTGTVIAARDDVEIVIEDGHTENLSGVLTAISGDNMLIRQAGTGTKPKLTFNDNGATGILDIIEFDGCENGVIENIEFADNTGRVVSNDISQLNAVQDSGATNSGVIGCKMYGERLVNEMSNFVLGNNIDGLLIQNCETEVTDRYSVVTGTGSGSTETYCGRIAVVGCTFDYSVAESCVRILDATSDISFGWNRCTQNGNKSTIRLWAVDYASIYGCYWSDGDNTLGDNIGNPETCTTARIEANFADGTSSTQSYLANPLESTVTNITTANNIVKTSDVNGSLKAGGVNYHLFHNTLWMLEGFNQSGIRATAATSTCYLNGNLCLHDDTTDITRFAIEVTSTVAEVEDNTFPQEAGTWADFAQVGGAPPTGANIDTVALFNSTYAFASGNEAKNVTLDSSYIADSTTTVTTASGVYDDYFGTARGSTSWAGAVGSEPTSESEGIFQTFIPGLIIQTP